jgi:type II secretory pathway component PulF
MPVATTERRQGKWTSLLTAPRITQEQVIGLCRQLSVLIDVGVPLLKALEIIENRTEASQLKGVIRTVAHRIETGEAFSTALAQFPRVFSRFFVNMITMAELGGVLDRTLKILADYLEKEAEIRRKVTRALIYPVISIGVSIAVLILVIAVIIPTFASLFAEANVELPWSTRFLVGFGTFLGTYWWLCLLVAVLLIMGGVAFARTPNGRLMLDRVKLHFPLFGSLITRAVVAEFCQTFGTLLQGGVPILRALHIVEETTSNQVLVNALRETANAVEQGSKVEEPLRKHAVFPPFAMDLIAIGEEAGQLDTMLLKVAEIYAREVDHMITHFSAFIEPLLLLVVGLITALIAYSVFIPYFSLGSIVLQM